MDKFIVRKRRIDDQGEETKETIKCKIPKPDKEERRDEEPGEETETDDCATSLEVVKPLKWGEIRGDNLNLDYCLLFPKPQADRLLTECEKLLSYNQGQLARVNIFGKWHDIPRKQVAHGDEGLSYSFSNNTVPARPWTPFLRNIRDNVTEVTGYDFNFVLINRYKDGKDYMGEHRDDEKDLVHGYPIASLSLGQPRDFVFRHADSRGKNATLKIEPVKLELQHGSLLMMKHPTNTFWYHSLPQRKKLTNVRINMTFRKMVTSAKKK